MKSHGSPKRITKQVYTIYRDDGAFKMLTQFNSGTDIDKSNCKEASKKKF